MTHPHSITGWIGLATGVSTAASLICNILPNANYLDGYPRTQKAYNTVITFIAAIAINIRHCLPSLDIPAPALGITKPVQPDPQLPSRATTLKCLAFLLFALCTLTTHGQDITNLYAAGGSYSSGASPAFAGTALYAHAVSPDTAPGMYAFTMIDAIPATVKPFTVSTNIAAGIGEKIATIANVPIFIPTAAGISFNGTNTGWAWSTGVAAPIQWKKGNFYIVPTLRVLKSSVSGGSGYQPVVGILFGWGK